MPPPARLSLPAPRVLGAMASDKHPNNCYVYPPPPVPACRPPRGYRDIAEVAAVAAAHGLQLAERVPMPANNFILVMRRAAAAL